MPSLHCNPGLFHWSHPRSAGSFRPHGKLHHVGAIANPSRWLSQRTLAARLIVGFNVGNVPTWTLDDLVKLVRRVREEQSGNPACSFVAQKGVYRHKDPPHEVVVEDGAQVLIINEDELSDADFTRAMIALGEEICRVMKQESIILEIQVNGMTQETMGIEA
jgi:hypothetical protein